MISSDAGILFYTWLCVASTFSEIIFESLANRLNYCKQQIQGTIKKLQIQEFNANMNYYDASTIIPH